MEHFTAHRLVIRAEVAEPLELNEHKGSALRGALYHGLRNRFCTMREPHPGPLLAGEGRPHPGPLPSMGEGGSEGECSACPLWGVCPVCTLVSTLVPENRLGRDAARPYTVQPPLDEAKTGYAPGEPLVFGLTLYAEAMRLFPYVVMAIQELETAGLGRRVERNRWRRGSLRVEEVWAENPLSGARLPVLQRGKALVQMPDAPITHQQVCAHAAQCAGAGALTLELLTPMRLTSQGRLVKPGELSFAVLLGRLLDRLESLAQHFSPTPLALDFPALVGAAARVRTVQDATRWVELRSYSTRQQRATPIGGLMGSVTFVAEDWSPFLLWLIWGQFTHVGKDAVKGNGWYVLRR